MRSPVRAVALVALSLVVGRVGAQAPVNAATAAPAKGGRQITAVDLKRWNTIRQTVMSNDGKWFAYIVAPVVPSLFAKG